MPISPSIDDFLALARSGEGNVIPVVEELVLDITPVVAAATVGRGPGSYLLESVVGGEKWGRYSFVGFEPDVIVRGRGSRFEEVAPGLSRTAEVPDAWQALRDKLAQYRPVASPALPRFWGGAVGYVSYDAARTFEPTVGPGRRANDSAWDFAFAIGGTLLVFDSVRPVVKIVVAAHVLDPAEAEATYARALEKIRRAETLLRHPVTARPMAPPDPTDEVVLPPSTFDATTFEAAVLQAQEHVRAGDVFQVVLSQKFRVPGAGADAFDVYRALRILNPSPYLYFLRFPEARIAGASPETLVRLEGRRVAVRPIAGTRPRGISAPDDAAIERELLADPKERAEHVMLVDLGRNDLGRIATPGSVRVSSQMGVERYSHVMHLVSNVEAELAEGKDAIDVLRATFPAGTLTGAPKVRAMQIIDELEPEGRGIYGGAVGYIGFDGNLDMAIAIRTVVEQRGDYTVQAGAGIVEASDPASEYVESVNKARAALVAIRAARIAKD